MKTSVNMVRRMGNFDVIQRTKDSMFNATTLLKQWNESSGQSKMISHFLENNSTKEFIKSLENDLNPSYRNYVMTKSRANKGVNAGTWMHPYLFIDFAMWINPRFKLNVIKFVYDQLIEYRHSAGDMYVGLTKALARLKSVDYSMVAKGLNYIVFGEHYNGRRNNATEEQLRDLTDLEKHITFLLDFGYISSFDQIMNLLRDIYNKKHEKF